MMHFMAPVPSQKATQQFQSVPALPSHPVASRVLFIVAKFRECTSLVFPSSVGIGIGKCYSPQFTVKEETRWE